MRCDAASVIESVSQSGGNFEIIWRRASISLRSAQIDEVSDSKIDSGAIDGFHYNEVEMKGPKE